jgi:hypothetical protein
MPINGVHCHVSKMINSDTCPRPTTDVRLQSPRAVSDRSAPDPVRALAIEVELGLGRLVTLCCCSSTLYQNL